MWAARAGLFRRAAYLCAVLSATFFVISDPGAFKSSAALSATSVQLQPVLTTDLSWPVLVTNAHDQSNRLFVVEQVGKIKVLQPGQTSTSTFLDISSRVSFGGESGLLGLAFHPQFATNGSFFVNYIRPADGATVIAEYHVSATDSNVADTHETVILTIAQPFVNHNGGMIEFGPDGFLYVATGDGGGSNDPDSRAQNINDLLGKMLRINIDHANGSVPYSSPPDNPFFGSTPGRDEIYAYGFRNPWRFSFDRATGQLYVGDVGEVSWEEVDIVTRGGNFGWRVFEGNHCTGLDPTLCSLSGYVPPITEYDHTGRCSITGGYAYRGGIGTLPFGAYVFGDYCSGEIFSFENGSQSVALDSTLNMSSFGEDEVGEIYVVGHGSTGAIHRIVNSTSPCSFVISPSMRSFGPTGGTGSVAVAAPINCAWTATSNDSFISITSGASGTGAGAVTYSVQANTGPARTGSMTIAGQTFTVVQAAEAIRFDFDGDRQTDIGVYRPSDGHWFIIRSGIPGPPSPGNVTVEPWGLPDDVPVPADYDGDGKKDIAVYRPSDGNWFIVNSHIPGHPTPANVRIQQWGLPGDIPMPADYDGDGKADITVYRPSDGNWFIINSSKGHIRIRQWGASGYQPVAGDYDGDGKADIAVYRPSDGHWFLLNSSNGQTRVVPWGLPGDRTVQADYDGDKKMDVAVFRPPDGNWFIINSSTGQVRIQQWGLSGDVPVPGDYDRDGRTDIAVYRPSDGNWFIINSSVGGPPSSANVRIQQWGLPGDMAIPSVYNRN